jgi:ABC-type transporter Mla subunit MlaD
MKTMSELKAQEVILLEKLSSEPKEWNNNLDSLIDNLNNQKNTLIKLTETSNTMVKDLQNMKEFNTVLSDDSISYLESISGLAKQVSENDLKNVDEKLEYFNKL